MAYTKYDWKTRDPITKARMQHIEDGIEAAASQADTNVTAITNLTDTLKTTSDSIWAAFGYSRDSLKNKTIQNYINELTIPDDLITNVKDLHAQVYGAITQGNTTLQSTIDAIRQVANANSDKIGSGFTATNTIASAVENINNALSAAKTNNYETLAGRINAIDEKVSGNTNSITNINNWRDKPTTSDKSATLLLQEIVGAHRTTNDTLDDRFDAIDRTLSDINGDGIKTKLTALLNEIAAARESTANSNATYANLDERLEADERNIKGVKDEVADAHRPGVENDNLNARFTAVESALSTAQTELGGRIDTVANTAAVASEVNTALSDIDARLDALDGGSIADTDDGGSLTGRVAELEVALDYTPTSDEDTTPAGLTQRINAAESDIDTLESNIGTINTALGTKANATDVETALAGKVSTEAMNTAITNAVQDISTTIIKNKNEVTYTDNVPSNTQTWTISDKDDYLLQAADDKYYYWKHINNEWHLMGGAGKGEGGGGTGNSNSENYTTYAAFEEAQKEDNKDYYVLQDDNLWHHYRYIASAGENDTVVYTRIEIGQIIDINKIKRYNIEKVYDEDEKKYYLKVYQYDYSENNNDIDTDLSDILPWKPSTTYSVDAQVVYNDGYAYRCIVANSDTEWTANNWEKISNICTIQFIELPEGGGGGASAGIVKRLTRIGDQTIETITNNQILLEAFYSYHTTELDDNGALVPIESSSGTYVLRSGNTVIETGTVPSGAYKATNIQPGDPGYMQFDVTKYCNIGNTTFELVVTTEGTQQTKNWTVRVIDLHLESEAPEVLLISSSESYNFPYAAFGALTKTLHVIIDNDTEHEITATLTSITSGRAATVTIPAQEHGAHSIDMYLEATVGGIRRTTEHLIREYIWYDDEVGTTILASPYNEQTITAQQYSTIEIPYQVYKKNASIIDVEYYLDQDATPFGSVRLDNTNTGLLTYLATDKGEHSITIKVDDITITTSLNITQLDINISPVEGAIIDFNPTTLENSSTNRLPSWTVGQNQYSFIDSNNFNWSEDSNGGGYKREEDGKALVIKAGTYIDLNYPIFANNILTQGAELKIIYKTKAVRKADAIWLSSVDKMYNKDVGLQLGAHSGWLKTTRAVNENVEIEPDENGVIAMNGINYNIWKPNTAYAVNDIVVLWDKSDEDNHQLIFKCLKAWDNTHDSFLNSQGKVDTESWLRVGKISANIAATDSYLYLSYSEQDKIELDINIDAVAQFIMSYEDGVPSKVYAYSIGTGGDGLTHTNTIHIGSDDCDVYLYGLRIYNKSLTTAEILQNFIADGKDVNEKIDRYNRNCIYWDPTQNDGEGGYFPSPSSTATLDPIKLAEVMPNVKVLMLDTPVFTTSKKDFIMNSTLRCIHATGGNVYTSRGDADNWLFTNGFHSGQGTTSDNYGQSARNVDFLFEVDGVHYPTKAKNMGKYTPSLDYVSKVYVGENASTWDTETETWTPTREPEAIEVCDDWKGDNCKISLTETSVPNNYFNLKVNVASSENVNNALFQKRYDDFLVYSSPAQTNQIAEHRLNYEALGQDVSKIKVKNSMEFVPAVLFIRENAQDANGNPLNHVEFNDCNWHFYALGNIGDSKKTDYTRAYDPDDMNEFTCENSDNNTNNGQFQSGVFNYNGHEAIETDYRAWSVTGEYVENDIVINDGVIYKCSVSNATTGTWINNQWTAVTYTNWTETNSTPYFAPRTNPNSMEYIFPIKPSQWNVQLDGVYLNRKHKTLIDEEFDGDHSFEFRYACRGDYRDGDLINVTEGQDDDAQFDLNRDVMLAFYEWVITSTPEQYQVEAPQWFVKSAIEFFYAYTHYYTMMDNRAKNTFWHFAKTGTYIEVSRPVKELLHVYEESSDNGTTWSPATGTEIDSNKKYRTQYAFDLWAYDMDTAAGIDNNGQLSFPYGKEDDDYRVENTPTSGYAFNGAGSIFWRRLKTVFASEIADVMNTAQRCFRAEDLINEFDRFQNCFPEEIWRLDIERKYIRTFTGASIDDSITVGKKNPRFLTAMMQGRKKYQRRQWIRNQTLYFNSKYRLSDITVSTNTTEFNVITPANANDPNIAVVPNYDLKLVPYQDMYINVTVGNGGPTPSQRVKAGETYILPIANYTSANFGETRIYIYGFSGISEIGNLASMYPYSFTLNALDHLKKLDMGTDASGYVNANLTSLPFTTDTELPLLESINIKNCHSLSGGLNLNRANNLRTVEAAGTTITGISLPQYTNIETLHLPSTVTDLVLYGAHRLTDLQIINNNTGVLDYSGLFNLNIYDSDYSSNIDWLNIAEGIIEKESTETNLSLLRLSTATITDIQELQPFASFKPVLENNGKVLELSGTIHVTGNWSAAEKNNYETVWPGLELDTTSGTETIKHKVTYLYDGKSKDIYVTHNDVAPEIYVKGGEMPMPTQASTPEYSYTFGSRDERSGDYIPYSGWYIVSDNNPSHTPLTSAPVVQDTLVLAAWFQGVKRQYSVRWLLDPEKVVKTSSKVDYGDGKDLQVPTVQDIHNAGYETCSYSINNGQVTYSVFNGWEKTPVNIQPDGSSDYYDIYPTWETNGDAPISLVDLFKDTTNLTPIQLYILSEMNETQRTNFTADKVAAGMRMTYQLGYDINTDNEHVIISDKTDAVYLNGSNGYSTNYQPLLAGADAFTLAIDYSFDDVEYNTINSFATLVSCYYSQNGVRNGFTLCKNLSSGVIEVGFGDMYRNNNQRLAISNVANSNMRNVVVLRHAAGSPTLQIYSGINGEQTLPTTVYSGSITRTGEVNFNSGAYLNVGQLIDRTRETIQNEDTSLTTVANAKGNIYWMKLWDEDLGEGACRSLANWPHEYLTLALAQLNSSATNHIYHASRADYVPTPTLQLASLNTLQHGLVVQSRVNLSTNNTEYGWHTSLLRTVLKDRLFYALPFTLQAIVSKANTLYLPAVYQEATLMENGQVAKGPSAFIRDYIVGYSAANVTPSTVNTYESESDMHPFSWRVSTSVQVFTYANNTWSEATGTDGTQYLNLRFPTKAIPFGTTNKLRVYVFPAASTIPSNFNVASTIGRDTLRSGDVYVENSTAYIYVSNKERNLYGLPVDTTLTRLTGLPDNQVDNIDSDNGGNGGWVKAEQYWTRSAIFGGTQYTAFATVNIEGGIDNNTSTSSNGYKFNYLLAI